MHQDVAAGQVQPDDAGIAHLVEQMMDLGERQFPGEILLAVVRVRVAMPTAQVAPVGQFPLGLDHLAELSRADMHSMTELCISEGGESPRFTHGARLGESNRSSSRLSIHRRRWGGR